MLVWYVLISLRVELAVVVLVFVGCYFVLVRLVWVIGLGLVVV